MFNSRQEINLNAAISTGCLHLWHRLRWKAPHQKALTHAKYTSFERHSHTATFSSSAHLHTQAHTVSYCVWESSGIWRAETLSGDLWPLVVECCGVTWGFLWDIQVTQRAVRELFVRGVCKACCVCHISWSTEISQKQQICYLRSVWYLKTERQGLL